MLAKCPTGPIYLVSPAAIQAAGVEVSSAGRVVATGCCAVGLVIASLVVGYAHILNVEARVSDLLAQLHAVQLNATQKRPTAHREGLGEQACRMQLRLAQSRVAQLRSRAACRRNATASGTLTAPGWLGSAEAGP